MKTNITKAEVHDGAKYVYGQQWFVKWNGQGGSRGDNWPKGVVWVIIDTLTLSAFMQSFKI